MMQFLEFTFQSFWHFAGVAILLTIVTSPLYVLGLSLGSRR